MILQTEGLVNKKPSLKKTIIVLSIIIISVVILFLLFREIDLLNIRAFIFPSIKQNGMPVLKGGILLEVKDSTQNRNGRIARGYFAKNGTELAVIFHGNKETIEEMGLLGWRFFDEGYSVLLVEYPGYGMSRQYKPSENAIYEDSEAILDHVIINYNFPIKHIFVVGYSLGSGVAVEMAKRKIASKIVLLAPFTSIPSVASRTLPVIPWLVIRDVFDKKQKTSALALPVLIIHGTNDKTVPYAEGVELAHSFKHAELITLEGVDHHLPVFVINNEQIWKKMVKFLNQ